LSLFGDEIKISKGARWKNTVLHSLGMIMLMLGISMVAPFATAVYYGENYEIFLTPLFFLVLVGLVVLIMFREGDEGLQATSGILMIGGAFLIMILVGAIPYIMYGMPLIDSLFESVSGVTTTGYTMVRDFDSFPQSLFLWRSMTQWIGGVSVILIFLYMLPIMGIGGKGFSINEMSGSGTKNFSVRLKDSAKSFLLIYVLLTAVQAILLMVFGVGAIDSACMTLSTVSTGGFLNKANSMSDYDHIVKIIVMAFMLLGGTNFYIHFKGLYRGQLKPYAKNTEFRWTIYWYVGISLLISALLVNASRNLEFDYLAETVADSLFTVVSMGTSTGFAVVNFTDTAIWPVPLCSILLLIIAFVGGMSGSTAGGVKMYRFVIIGKYIKNSIYKTLHPMAVYDVKMDGDSVEEPAVMNSFVTLALFTITIVIAAVIFMMAGILPIDSIGLAVTSTCNTGASIGEYGPYDTLYTLDPIVKAVMMLIMFLGRLEIATALLFFMPGFWKEVARNRGKRTRRVSDFSIRDRIYRH
jgi:trk system potassium uptake protein TrkH